MKHTTDCPSVPRDARREIRAEALEDMADAWPILTSDPGNRKTVQATLRAAAAAIRSGA